MTFNFRKTVFLFAFGGWLITAGSAAWAADSSLKELIGALKSADETARLTAIDRLGAQGEKAAEAVAPLAVLLKDPTAMVRAHAAMALGEIGEPSKSAAPALVDLLKDGDEVVRRQAVKALVKIRPGPKVMLPLFVQAMESSDPSVQVRILHAISEAGEAAVPGLINALQNEKVAYWACIVLRDIGPSAKAAVPALTAALKNPHPDVRREAVLALGAMNEAAIAAVPQIAESLSDEHACTAATFVLGELGKIPADAEAKIRANAKSDDKTLATVSLWALARVHPEDKELLRETAEKLIENLKDKDPFVRVAAARALAALPPAPEIMVPIWEKSLQNTDATTAQYALDALATLGSKAVPRLIGLLKHKELRVHVVYVLGQIGPGAAPAVETIAKFIGDEDQNLATEAMIAIGKIGPDAKAAVPALLKSLEQENCPNAHAIVYTLGRIGPNAAAAEPALLKKMKSNDGSLAVVSAWAFTKIAPRTAKPAIAIPVFMGCLSDSLPETRLAAAEGLAELGPAAREAVPALKKALNDESKSVREAAAKALQAVEGSGVKKG
jgi:HEAT repeat protein